MTPPVTAAPVTRPGQPITKRLCMTVLIMEAVVIGLARTGRLVTSAALILFFAFAALASSPGTDIKVMGTALGVGILIDANWVSGATKARPVSARIVLTAAQPGTVRRRLEPILARDAEAGIDVAPFGVGPTDANVDARWRPPGAALPPPDSLFCLRPTITPR